MAVKGRVAKTRVPFKWSRDANLRRPSRTRSLTGIESRVFWTRKAVLGAHVAL